LEDHFIAFSHGIPLNRGKFPARNQKADGFWFEFGGGYFSQGGKGIFCLAGFRPQRLLPEKLACP